MRRVKKSLCVMLHLCFLSFLPFVVLVSCSLCVIFSALGSSCIMTKRDSLLAGFTSPSTSMSMPRRHSRSHGYPSSTAAPSDSNYPARSVTDFTESTAWPSFRHAGSSGQSSHYGYSTEAPSVPLPAPADHQTPIPPGREEAYPLQMEIEETRRQLHAHYFTEVRTPQADSSQPELRRLMVTEVDRYGVHRNRQPEFFFNGIIGHIRADQNGWIDSWEQATQLANYWRRHFQIPEVHHDGNWYHYPQESNSANQAGESQESLPGSDMEDTDSLIVHAKAASAPSQIHQLATVLWNILNNDREANLAILEKLENPATDPIQVFSAADLAHLASHLAQTTRHLSQQAQLRAEGVLSNSDNSASGFFPVF